ncbi:hypothetical protein TNCV_3063671 [Trichonephila clavipes]|nr:hypothetical protein TNCV_3063671 [Trichonephila clavipes]
MSVISLINQFKHSPSRDYLFYFPTPDHSCGPSLTEGIPFPPVQTIPQVPPVKNNKGPSLTASHAIKERSSRGQKTLFQNTLTLPKPRQHSIVSPTAVSNTTLTYLHKRTLRSSSLDTSDIRESSVQSDLERPVLKVVEKDLDEIWRKVELVDESVVPHGIESLRSINEDYDRWKMLIEAVDYEVGHSQKLMTGGCFGGLLWHASMRPESIVGGEALVENLSKVGDGIYRQGFQHDVFYLVESRSLFVAEVEDGFSDLLWRDGSFLPVLQSRGGRDEDDLVLDVFCDTTLIDGGINLFCETCSCRVDVLLFSNDGVARDGRVEEELELILVCERAAIMGR